MMSLNCWMLCLVRRVLHDSLAYVYISWGMCNKDVFSMRTRDLSAKDSGICTCLITNMAK